MTYELKILSKGKNYNSCVSYKGYRKDLNKCITTVNNAIDKEIEENNKKDIVEFRVRITSFGKKIYERTYIPIKR